MVIIGNFMGITEKNNRCKDRNNPPRLNTWCIIIIFTVTSQMLYSNQLWRQAAALSGHGTLKRVNAMNMEYC